MALPIFRPQIQQEPLPSDIMGRIAGTQQRMAQVPFVAPMLKAQLAQRLAQTAAMPQIARQRAAQTGLAQAQTGAIPSEISLREAQAEKAAQLPVTDVQKIKNAQDLARTALRTFGPNDIRTTTAFANLAKLTGFKGLPKQSEVPPYPTSQTNSTQANATINQANTQHTEIPEHQATAEINQAIPKSYVATPEQQAAAQPLVDKQQKFNQEATRVLNEVGAKTTEDPFSKAQALQLDTEWKNINAAATSASGTELPLYKSLSEDLENTNLVGPLGHILWTTPAGQKLRADLTRAQGEFIKSFHLGRMTQIEFNFLKNAIGKATVFPSALRKLFQGVMAKDHTAMAKLDHYHDYIAKGGRKTYEVDSTWQKALPNIQKESASEASDDIFKIRIGKLPVTEDQLATLAKNNNITEDQALNELKKANAEGKL